MPPVTITSTMPQAMIPTMAICGMMSWTLLAVA